MSLIKGRTKTPEHRNHLWLTVSVAVPPLVHEVGLLFSFPFTFGGELSFPEMSAFGSNGIVFCHIWGFCLSANLIIELLFRKKLSIQIGLYRNYEKDVV